MDNLTNELGLKLPIIDNNYIHPIKLNVESFEKWRSELPTTDTGKTAKEILTTIKKLNITPCESSLRLKLTNIIYRPLQMVCQTLKKHYVLQTAQIDKKKINIATLEIALQLELAYSYKLIIDYEYTNNKKDNPQKTLISAIRSAIEALSFIIFISYQIYTKPPKNSWKELNILYTYAMNNSLTKLDNKISDLFTEIALFSATDPLTSRQTEQEKIYHVLTIWSKSVTIRQSNKQDEETSGMYIIDTSLDKPFIPCGLKIIENKASCLTLELTNLSKKITHMINELDKDEIAARIKHEANPEYSVPIPVLKKLKKSWDSIIIRQENRFDVSLDMKLAFGLAAVHYFINGEREFAPKDLQKEKQQEIKKSELIIEETEISEEEINKVETINKTQSKYQSYQYKVVNLTQHGLCAVWEHDELPPTQAGEIVSTKIDPDNPNSPWNIGIVRWISRKVDKKVKIGIDLISATTIAASIQPYKNEEPSGYYLRCLISNINLDENNQDNYIITPTIPFKTGSIVGIQTTGSSEIMLAKLTSEIDSTGSIKKFNFLNLTKAKELEQKQQTEKLQAEQIKQKMELEKQKNTTDKKNQNQENSDKDDEFKDIWDDL